MKESMTTAGYWHVGSIKYTGKGKVGHVLCDRSTGNQELWYSNKNHASYGIIYKNTHLEFACTLKQPI
jgi:hypothetical protein